jgi:hypothetical protein
MRLIAEGGLQLFGNSFCDICGSSQKKAFFGLGQILGCIQPKCWNYFEWKNLPAGVNKSILLYGAPKKPQPPPSPPKVR